MQIHLLRLPTRLPAGGTRLQITEGLKTCGFSLKHLVHATKTVGLKKSHWNLYNHECSLKSLKNKHIERPLKQPVGLWVQKTPFVYMRLHALTSLSQLEAWWTQRIQHQGWGNIPCFCAGFIPPRQHRLPSAHTGPLRTEIAAGIPSEVKKRSNSVQNIQDNLC